MKKPTQKTQKAKKITMDDLAMMVQRGFMEMGGRIDELRTETNGKIDSLRTETNGKIDSLRAETRDGFARIENVLLRGHENRIEKIEDDTRILKTAVLR